MQQSQVYPPRNSAAIRPDEVYDLNDIISKDDQLVFEVACVDDISSVISNQKVKEIVGKRKFDKLLTMAAVYLDALSALYKTKARELMSKEPLLNEILNETVRNLVLDRFCVWQETSNARKARKVCEVSCLQ